MISPKHRCVFVKVPKTAGTSMARALQCEAVGKPHRNIVQIRDIMDEQPGGRARFDGCFKFGFVRNPWDRVVSLYNRAEGEQSSSRMTFDAFVDWIEHASDTCVHPSPHRDQLDWFTDEHGQVAVDFIGRFERLADDWTIVCDRIGAAVPLGHFRLNERNQQHYAAMYTPATRATIERKFQVDIEHFGYTFDGAVGGSAAAHPAESMQ